MFNFQFNPERSQRAILNVKASKKLIFFCKLPFAHCPLLSTYCLLPIALCLFASCNSTYTSKKKGYFKIDYPERKYVAFQQEGFPYTFEYPVYAKVIKDSTYFDSNPENPYWVNIDFPQFGGRIFLSYKIVGGKAIYKLKQQNGTYRDSAGINKFDNMVNDAYKLTNKNQAITSSIKDSIMLTPNGVSGIFFKVGGNAATSKQFFLSDTTKNFIRGALYFDVTPNADSLRPVQDFLQADIEHMINTFKWTNKSTVALNKNTATAINPPQTQASK
jgi:gliding motility-associated lipoprotein GldD